MRASRANITVNCFFDVWYTNVLLAEVCDKIPAEIRFFFLISAGFHSLPLRVPCHRSPVFFEGRAYTFLFLIIYSMSTKTAGAREREKPDKEVINYA